MSGFSTITSDQVKRLHTIATRNNWGKDAVKELVSVYKGIPVNEVSTRMITQGQEYDDLCNILNNEYTTLLDEGLLSFATTFRGQITMVEDIKSDTVSVIAEDLEWRHPDTGLNKQQQSVYEEVLDKLRRNCLSVYTIIGSAGTGKTFTIQRIVEQIKRENPKANICLSAPTHKAVKVLKKMAAEKGLADVDFATIYSLLKLKVDIDDSGRHKVQKNLFSDSPEPIYSYQVVIIDEASMINSEVYDNILNTQFSSNPPIIIFMGDALQLPPVGGKESKVFNSVQSCGTLTQIMRYGGSIGSLVEGSKKAVRSKQPFNPLEYSHFADESLHYLNNINWLELAMEMFSSQQYQDDSDYCKVLAFTNEKVAALNTLIRSAIYGGDPEKFYPGEVVIANKPIVISQDTVANTNDELKVLEVTDSEIRSPFKITKPSYKGLGLKLEVLTGSYSQAIRLNVVHPEHESNFLKDSLKLRDVALSASQPTKKQAWRAYYDHLSLSAPLTYNYALTVHKSQGSGFTHCFVDATNIESCKDKTRQSSLYYVALSRAKKGLYINKPAIK